MNVGLIGVIVALAVLLLKLDFSSKRINDFLNLYDKSLSDLAKAKRDGIIDEEKHKKAAHEINECYKDFKKGYDRLKWAEWLKQFLPIFLIFEILHITLQEFQWSNLYEWIAPPGLNKLYVVIIILVMLLYLVLGLFRITDKKILHLESQIISVIARYLYDFV